MVQLSSWKLYHYVPRTALPIHFFSHFTVGCNVSFSLKTQRTATRLMASTADFNYIHTYIRK